MVWTDELDRVVGHAKREFGETVTYTPRGGSPVSITAVLKVPAIPDDTFVTDTYLRLMLRSADLAATPAQGDRVTARGVIYLVVDVKDNIAGGAELKLKLA